VVDSAYLGVPRISGVIMGLVNVYAFLHVDDDLNAEKVAPRKATKQ
jgi:hypothetical protein